MKKKNTCPKRSDGLARLHRITNKMKLAFTSATANWRHQLICGFILLLLPLGTIYVILHQVLTSVWSFWILIRCEDSISVWRFEFGVSDLNSVWAIWNRYERFEFGASVFEFGVSVFEFSVNNLNLVWVIRIRCEWFEFGVSDLNLVCTCRPPYGTPACTWQNSPSVN